MSRLKRWAIRALFGGRMRSAGCWRAAASVSMARGIQTLVLVFGVGLAMVCNADVTLSPLFSDHAVLQREMEIPVWGRAEPGEKVTVTLENSRGEATAGKEGAWMVRLAALPAGGPYTLTVTGKNTLEVKDVLIGEVWLCSGQSNMAHPINDLRDRETILNEADGPYIRWITVPNLASLTEVDEIAAPRPGQSLWEQASPQMSAWTYAPPYFFARELHKKLKVPVGMLCAALGSTCGETWASRQSLEDDAQLRHIAQTCDEAIRNYPERIRQYGIESASWFDRYFPRGSNSAGFRQGFHEPGFDDSSGATQTTDKVAEDLLAEPLSKETSDALVKNTSSWKPIGSQRVFGRVWAPKNIQHLWSEKCGTLWLRAQVEIPEKWLGKDLELNVGPIQAGYEDVYFNGLKVESTYHDEVTSDRKPRVARIPGPMVKSSRAVIALHMTYGPATRFMDRPYLALAGAKTERVFLDWKYRVELTREPGENKKLWSERPPPPMSPDEFNFPFSFYNGTIAPLAPYAIRGVAWYQGESNAGRAYEYRQLQKALIRGWRRKWGQGDFPYLICQLSTVSRAAKTLGDSTWAELREAQALALAETNTALIVTTDLGDGNIHPQDKAGIAKRLALAAMQVAYGMDVVSSGPGYASSREEAGKMIIRFARLAGGLVTRDGAKLQGFIIAGEDKAFVPAEAEIKGNQVLVWSKEIGKPVAVRYAWSENPREANLFNKEGLPAVPFRTDAWPGITAAVVWPGP